MVLGSEIVRLESWVLWLRVRRLLLCAVSREDAAPERVGREWHGQRQEGSAEPAWLQEGGVELAASGGVCLRVVVFEALWQCSARLGRGSARRDPWRCPSWPSSSHSATPAPLKLG